MRSSLSQILKALPLGVALPIMIAVSSVKPEDAASNLSAWGHWLGIHNIPDWLANPALDRKVLYGTLLTSAVYAFVIWGLPQLRRNSQQQPGADLANIKAAKKAERIFVPPEVTLERLLSFYDESTAMQAAKITDRYLGQWMRVSGVVGSISPFNGYFSQVSFARPPLFERKTWFDQASIYLLFNEPWVDRLAILKQGDKITAICQIDRIDPATMNLRNCELVDEQFTSTPINSRF
jgi:hypothetical protein